LSSSKWLAVWASRSLSKTARAAGVSSRRRTSPVPRQTGTLFLGDRGGFGYQPVHLQGAAVRAAERLRTGRKDRRWPLFADGQSISARKLPSRTNRLREGPPRKARVRNGRPAQFFGNDSCMDQHGRNQRTFRIRRCRRAYRT
jgi:hypothetical protein